METDNFAEMLKSEVSQNAVMDISPIYEDDTFVGGHQMIIKCLNCGGVKQCRCMDHPKQLVYVKKCGECK